MEIPSGEVTSVFIFISLLNGDLLLKEFAHVEANSFTLRVDSILEGFCYPGKDPGSHKNCLPLKNGGHFMVVYLYILRKMMSGFMNVGVIV